MTTASSTLTRAAPTPRITLITRRQAMQEAVRLRYSGHTVEELTKRLAEMKAQIRDWEDEFDVESPNQLRGTLADETLDADKEDRRRDVARKWEHP